MASITPPCDGVTPGCDVAACQAWPANSLCRHVLTSVRTWQKLANLRRHRGLVVQRLGRHRLSGADQEIAASRRISGALLRRAGDQHLVLWPREAGVGQAVEPHGARGESRVPLYRQAQPRLHPFAHCGDREHFGRDYPRHRRRRAPGQGRLRIDCHRGHRWARCLRSFLSPSRTPTPTAITWRA